MACETYPYDDPARDETPVLVTAEDGGARDNGSASGSREDRDDRSARRYPRRDRNDDLLKSDGSQHDPVPIVPGEPCPEEYPVVRADGCYALSGER